MKFKSINDAVQGLRHTRQYLGGLFVLFSSLALFASFMLSIETLYEARHPGEKLICDINAVLSCSTVAASNQAEIIGKIIPFFGGLTIPNAFFGMIFETVFVTIGVLLISNARLPKWFMTASQIGNFMALIFAYWLFYQSSFVIGALCPWCMLLMFSTTFQFFTQLHFNILDEKLAIGPKVQKWATHFVSAGFEAMLVILIVLILVAIVILKYNQRLFI
ncbi:MAG: vitamin K epoxide reductase family protein [Candidatus Ancillula sp.]|jgi:uncharacterized membrane protein|nr:vitamin K epoxide reductase family protein [Candidatus Ancillula sp.]